MRRMKLLKNFVPVPNLRSRSHTPSFSGSAPGVFYSPHLYRSSDRKGVTALLFVSFFFTEILVRASILKISIGLSEKPQAASSHS